MSVEVPDILKRIVERKWQEIAEQQAEQSWSSLQARVEAADPVRGFVKAVNAKVAKGEPAVIAEVKKASPSKGVLRADFQPAQIALDYQAHGAACLSVLTDVDFFQGDDDYLRQARQACQLPVLRKDFIVDPWQVYQARAMGADCILLIVACLDDKALASLHQLATELGMDVLVEVHDAAEMARAVSMGAPFIGVNNRDLRTFEVSLQTTLDLLERYAGHVDIVTESGILSQTDVSLMRQSGIERFLVGEAFMRQPSPGAALKSLFYSA